MLAGALASTRHTIRALRIVAVAAVALPLAALGLFAWISYGRAVADAEQQVVHIADVLHQHSLKVFETHELILDAVAAFVHDLDWHTIETASEVQSLLDRLAASRDQVASIWLVDAGGVPRAASVPFPRGQANALQRDYFLVQRERDAGTYVGKGYVGVATGKASFGVSRRKPAADGSFDGTIHVAVSSDYFVGFFNSLTPNPQGHYIAVLYREDGEILARTPPRPDAPTRYEPDRRILVESRQQQQGIYWSVSPADGVNRVRAFRAVAPWPVYVVFGVDESTALAPWRRNLVLYGAIALVAIAAFETIALLALQRARREESALLRLGDESHKRETAEAALLQAQKMEAVGQLAGGIAHDFNNLLTVIAGNAEIGLRQQEAASRTRAFESILRAADSGEGLTRQLLSFSRRQPLNRQTIDLTAHVPKLTPMLANALRGGISLEVDLPERLWPVELDRGELDLALLNLALNARDAMPRGGTLSIVGENCTYHDDPPGLVGDFVVLRVRDTGHGMPPEVAAHAFDPFFTTKEAGKGTGLGLAQVYGCAVQAGGFAAIETAPDAGTTVTLFLRRVEGKAPATDVPHREGGGTSAVILLVEDNAEVAAVGRQLLQQLGYAVITVDTAAAALDRLAEADDIDLVLSDIVMPGELDGLGLAAEIAKRHPHVPVVLATGYSEVAHQETRFPVIRKPYSLGVLAETIERELHCGEAA